MSESMAAPTTADAAILLMSIGEENAANVLQHMNPDEVQAIGEVMAEMGSVTQDEISKTLDVFNGSIRAKSSLGSSNRSFLRTMLEKAIGPERSLAVLSQVDENSLAPALEVLKWIPSGDVARLVCDEHPQYIAIVISYLDKEKGAAVLEYLDEDVKTDIVIRLAKLDAVHPTALMEIDAILEKRFSETISVKVKGVGGVKKVAEILNSVSSEEGEAILSRLETEEPDLATEIRDSLFVFENLLEIDGRGIQTILREISGDLLINALKGSSEELRKKLFDNMSKRAAVLLADDLEAKGPVRLTDVEDAQKEILTVVTRLADEGKIQVGGQGDDYV